MNEVTQGSPADEALVGQVADEFLDRLERGEGPDIEEYAARYPQQAAVLRDILAALQLLHSAEPASDESVSQPERPARCLGDFRIVREVGKGGMGVVYEAEQLSLGRRVALKVLPFAAALDARQLQRFKNEAQAAAHLHHSNIVPVFAVGCERGVHYYAMQFIDGQTVADMIAELRRLAGLGPQGQTGPALAGPPPTGPYRCPGPGAEPTANPSHPTVAGGPTHRSHDTAAFFRSAAQLAVQAAQALEHAHQLGVIHRDIKPANLMVDGRGNLWVTDFGLAQVQGDTRLTRTGDLVGTLRYMSPEQAAAGQRNVIDHRSDIYSLGVTLYELLTLEPAFPGSDSREVLRQIAFGEPRSPRRLNPALPAELETIVLKAMAHNPDERYPTAQALADDLERFLADRPVLARRPTLWQRARKLARRHRPVVVTALVALAVLLVLGVAGLLVYAIRITGEQARTLAERDRAERERDRAERRTRQTWQAYDDLYTRLAKRWISQQPRLEPLQREYLEKALRFYEEFVEEQADDPRARLEASLAARRVGEIHFKLGSRDRAETAFRRALALVADDDTPPFLRERAAAQHGLGDLFSQSGEHDRAEQAYGQALGLWRQLLARFPDDPGQRDHRNEMAGTYINRGTLRGKVGRSREAEDDYRQALARLQELVRDHPNETAYQWGLAGCHVNLGQLLADSDGPARAEECYRLAMPVFERLLKSPAALPEHFQAAALVYNSLGALASNAGRPEDADRALVRAVALLKNLANDFPLRIEYREQLVQVQSNRGNALRDLGRGGQAETLYRQAIAQAEELVRAFPTAAAHRAALAGCRQNLGVFLAGTGRLDDAEREHREAHRLYAELVQQFPRVPAHRQDLADANVNLAIIHEQTGQATAAERAYHAAIEQYTRLAGERDRPAEPRKKLLECRHRLGQLHQRRGCPECAEESFRQALAEAERLAADFPRQPECRALVPISHNTLAGFLAAHGLPCEAEEAYRQAIAAACRLADDFPREPRCRAILSGACVNLGVLLERQGRHGEAEAAYRAALAIKEELVKKFRGVPHYAHDLAVAHGNLGVLLEKQGRLARAGKCYTEALRILVPLAGASPRVASFQERLALGHEMLARLRHKQQRPDDAAAAFRQAVPVRAKLVEDHPGAPRYPSKLAQTHAELAEVLAGQGDLEGACGQLREACKRQRAALRLAPGERAYREQLRGHCVALAVLLWQRGDHAELARLAEEPPRLFPAEWQEWYRGAAWLSGCVELAEKAAREPARNSDLAARYASRAVQMLRQAVEHGLDNAVGLKQSPAFAPLRQRDDFRRLLTGMEARRKQREK